MIPKVKVIEGKLNQPLPLAKARGRSQREVEKGLATKARLSNLAFPN
jgi:hypothetical protein